MRLPFRPAGLLALALLVPACGKKSAPPLSAATPEEAPAAPAPAAANTPPASAGYVLVKKGLLPAPGTVRTDKLNYEQPESALAVKRDFKTMKGSSTRKTASTEVIEGLAPGKARRTLTSMTNEERTTYNGQEDIKPDKGDPLQGVPVILEYKDGTWTAELESGTPDSGQQVALKELLDGYKSETDLVIFGETPRKPGEKWVVDASKVERFCGATGLEGPFSVEFLKVADVNGVPCAVLKTTFNISGKPVGTGDEAKSWKLSFKGNSLIHRSLTDLTDFESKIDCNYTMDGSPGGRGVTMSIDGPLTIQTLSTLSQK
ncbi:hypothetical protein [Haloferula sp. BvORR071]|uniref:hypothetical protein n=1 Tax=Haloferula sp. BvORR071 TaxID=1396141 RepID=UPI00054FF662|nr:hypothetical protein [Haloferula sp. BvORR071]